MAFELAPFTPSNSPTPLQMLIDSITMMDGVAPPSGNPKASLCKLGYGAANSWTSITDSTRLPVAISDAQVAQLIARLPPLAATRVVLLNAVTAAGASAPHVATHRYPVSLSVDLSGAGSVSATVELQARNASGGLWSTLATITLSGAGAAAGAAACVVPYMEFRANLTAISGTSAQATAVLAV